MNLKTLVIILAGAAVVGGFGAIPAAWSAPGQTYKVLPCSLDGVNPAHHPWIFRHAKVAKSYGFVKGPDGAWQVVPDCHRWVAVSKMQVCRLSVSFSKSCQT